MYKSDTMRKGDKIRFLDAVGGGTIVQYDAQQQLVWVETDDGFDVGPIPATKCVMDTAATSYQLPAQGMYRYTQTSRNADYTCQHSQNSSRETGKTTTR